MSDGPVVGARYSLGREACRWIQASLAVPDGKRYGLPIRLSTRQAQFLISLFEFEWTGTGWRRVIDRAFDVEPKGVGKSPAAAMVAAFVAIGPSVPHDLDGRWLVGRPDPTALVQVFANSERQGKRTIWTPLTSMLRNGRLADDVFIGKTFVEAGHSYVHYEAASADSAEGPRVNLAICEETQYWRSVDMWNLWETIRRNIGKKDGFILAPTNAPARGGGSVADDQISVAERGGVDADELLVFFPQATTKVPDLRGDDNKPAVMAALTEVYGSEASDPKSGWVDLDVAYRKLVGGKERAGRRYYLNEMSEDEGRLVRAPRFDFLARPGVKIPPGQFVVLGFDGSESEDATALVAVSCTEPPHAETVGIWAKPPGVAKEDYRIPKAEVRAALELCRERWRVELLVGDPSISWKSFFTDFAEQWGIVSPAKVGDRTTRAGWGLVCEIWMNSPSITHAVVSHFIGLMDGEATEDEINDPEAELPGDHEVTFTHDADPELVRHTNALVKTTAKAGRFVSVAKASESVDDRNDAGVALMLALWGASRFPAYPPDPEPLGAGDGADDDLMARLLR